MIWIGLVGVLVIAGAWFKVRRNRKSVEAAMSAN
jgi:LPXTG-motif cell wall-anchored protein